MSLPFTEPSLLERAKAGDADAFCQLCRGCESRLLRQALALCGERSLAEDLAQDTLVEGWKSLHRYNGKCQFFTWLCAILLNRYRNTVRGRRAVSFSHPGQLQESPEAMADAAFRPDQAAQMREQEALVWQCLEALPEKQRQVIYLRFYVDHSLEGIAAALGCSLGTVKSRLFHALERLRNMNALRAPRKFLQPENRIL